MNLAQSQITNYFSRSIEAPAIVNRSINVNPSNNNVRFMDDTSIESRAILSLNIRGITDKDKRHAIMKRLYKSNPAVIMLQDVREKSAVKCTSACGICASKRYSTFFTGSNSRRGIITMINKDFVDDPVFIKGYSIGSEWHALKVTINDEDWILVNAYGPNDRTPEYYSELRGCIRNRKTLIAGDLNIIFDNDLDRTGSTAMPIHLNKNYVVGMMNDLDMIDGFRARNNEVMTSWTNNNVASRLDHVLISRELNSKIGKITYIAESFSDHKILRVDINNTWNKKKWRLSKVLIDDDEFINEVKNKLSKFNVDKASAETFYIFFFGCIIKTARSFVFGLSRRRDMEDEMLNDLLNGNDHASIETNDMDREFRIADIIHDERLESMATENDPLKKYKFLALGKSNNSNVSIKKLVVDGVELTEVTDITNAFKNHYAKIFSKEKRILQKRIKRNKGTGRMFSKEKIIKYIKSDLKVGKACGLSGIPAELFKKIPDEASRFLLKFAKEMEEKGHVPEQLLEGRICLIPKKGGGTSISDWRPLTILNISYRILSGIIAKSLGEALGDTILTDQKGFMIGRRISDNSHNVESAIEAANRNDKNAAIIAIDFSKAFDSVRHKHILNTVFKYLPRKFFNPIRSLLDGGVSRIVIEGIESDKMKVLGSTRQGCPASPLLFCLAVNDLNKRVRSRMRGYGVKLGDEEKCADLYADDFTGFLECEDENVLKSRIGLMVKLFEDFRERSGLNVNKSKTHILPVGKWRPVENEIAGCQVSETVEILGVKWDRDGVSDESWTELNDLISSSCQKWRDYGYSIMKRVEIYNAKIVPTVLYKAGASSKLALKACNNESEWLETLFHKS